MSAREECDQYFANQIVVTDDDFLHLGFQAPKDFAKLLRPHHFPLPHQRTMPRYSIGTCCFSLRPLGTWAGNGTSLTGPWFPIRPPFASFVDRLSPSPPPP